MAPPPLLAGHPLPLTVALALGTVLLCATSAQATDGEPGSPGPGPSHTAPPPSGPSAGPSAPPSPGGPAQSTPSPLATPAPEPTPSAPDPPLPTAEPPPLPDPPAPTRAPAPPPRRPEPATTTTSRGDGVGVQRPAPTPSPPPASSPDATPSPSPSRDPVRAMSARVAPPAPEPSGTPTEPADLAVRYGYDPVAPARWPGLLRYAPSCALGLLAALTLVLRLSVGWPRFPPRYRGRRRTTGESPGGNP